MNQRSLIRGLEFSPRNQSLFLCQCRSSNSIYYQRDVKMLGDKKVLHHIFSQCRKSGNIAFYKIVKYLQHYYSLE